MSDTKLFLATDRDGELCLFVGLNPPDEDETGIFVTSPDSCGYCGQVHPENIDGPIPAPGTFVECRLTITKAGAE